MAAETTTELGPRNVRRSLECFGGPEDGERKSLEADESNIELATGRYTPAFVTFANGSGRMVLFWRADTD